MNKLKIYIFILSSLSFNYLKPENISKDPQSQERFKIVGQPDQDLSCQAQDNKSVPNLNYTPQTGLKKPETLPNMPFWHKVFYIWSKIKSIKQLVILF